MVDKHFVTVIVLIVIGRCYSVDTDYLDEENSSQNTTSCSDARRNVVEKEQEISECTYDNGDIIKSFYYKTRPRSRLREWSPNNNNKNYKRVLTKNKKKSKNIQSTTKVIPTRDIFKDYYDNYEYDTYEKVNESEVTPYEFSTRKDIFIARHHNRQKSIFYNLEPVVDDTFELNKTNVVSDKIWYTTQRLPCWELPIVFGEMERKNRNPSVFLLYKDKLKNVEEQEHVENNVYRELIIPPSKSVSNKWCEIEPCFGDHTLCLFTEDDYKPVCGKYYKVLVPTVLQQLAIVNTVNSMRNNIANGFSKRYPHLPPAANMNQVLYDLDLQRMAKRWLKQCLPGSAPCSSIDGTMVTELECTKYAKHCCFNTHAASKCIAKTECYVFSIIGCIHVWFWKAGSKLTKTDIECGRASPSTFPSVQLFWARTAKIGCAYAQNKNGDERVICNFSPGAPFFIETKLYCGIISYKAIGHENKDTNITTSNFTSSLGLQWKHHKIEDKYMQLKISKITNQTHTKKTGNWKIANLNYIYREGWGRKHFDDWTNGTRSWIAVLVARHRFIDEGQSRCDFSEQVYIAGKPGERCAETGQIFYGLCDDYSDPTPGYRLVAVIAPMLLFSLVLYDLFSGIVGQNNY